ncbi:hypothetical protein GPECTOR_40g532 [Gonium pectorale]|uniref:Uncharacterized protein n=1 Tax=Gonium pectorale TaxID=33097 RepID=A0A150GAE9_GONPE|nr:hypothetical protein GPECTOR_40g532 [Gonium pectorale]|eukprot:KXZ46798.1 hypothetical protein GPECTOR_40g532 [Gonium pectorale]
MGVLPASRDEPLPPSETSLLTGLSPELAAERVAALRALVPHRRDRQAPRPDVPDPPFDGTFSRERFLSSWIKVLDNLVGDKPDPLDALLRARPGSLLSEEPEAWFFAQLGRADALGLSVVQYLEVAAAAPGLLDADAEAMGRVRALLGEKSWRVLCLDGGDAVAAALRPRPRPRGRRREPR